MAGTLVALLRGINVGRANRVAMADLRALCEGLGYTNVRTVLASGNVLLDAAGTPAAKAAVAIERALSSDLGVESRVTVITAAELEHAAGANPLAKIAKEPKRLQVAVLASKTVGRSLEPLVARRWTPEALAVDGRFAWMWCPAGVIKSPLYKAVDRAAGASLTVRNLATITKLRALLSEAR